MIIHFTTVHSRLDTRIRYKEVYSLSKAYPKNVALYVQDGLGHDLDNEILIYDTGKRFNNRLKRIMLGSWKMYKAISAASPKIVHFHDPELIPIALLLKLKKIKVIFDAHEDVSKQILAKPYLPAIVRKIFSKTYSLVEKFAAHYFDLIVCATPSIAEKFRTEKSVVIRNFPRADIILETPALERENTKFSIIYAGSLSKKRGILDLLEVISILPENFSLHLLGKWSTPSEEQECMAHPGWKRCHYWGKVPHHDVPAYLKRCDLGVQLTHDIPNHQGGLPTKVFEYMFAKIPSLISDTQEKRDFFKDLVFYSKSANAKEIAEKILLISQDNDKRKLMITNAHSFARQHYSWETEKEKLLHHYSILLKGDKN